MAEVKAGFERTIEDLETALDRALDKHIAYHDLMYHLDTFLASWSRRLSEIEVAKDIQGRDRMVMLSCYSAILDDLKITIKKHLN